jgi:hypothetical protein
LKIAIDKTIYFNVKLVFFIILLIINEKITLNRLFKQCLEIELFGFLVNSDGIFVDVRHPNQEYYKLRSLER